MGTIIKYSLSLLYLIIGLLGTGIVIFIHELGHYICARLQKVNVEVLSFGFGKTIYSHYGKNTEFRISLIPFGGYCTLGGSEDLSVALRNNDKKIHYAEDGSLFAISPFRKFLIYLSGPLMNLLLAFLLFFIVALIPVERVSNKAVITPISEYKSLFNVSIEQRELKKGDIVLSIDGERIIDYEDLCEKLGEKNGENALLTVLRQGEKIDVVIHSTTVNGTPQYGITNLVESVIGRSESDLFTPGDRIIECNGEKIENNLDLLSIKGDEYNLLVLSEDGKTRKVTLLSSSFPFAFKTDLRKSAESKNALLWALDKTKVFFNRTFLAISKLMTLHVKEALEEISGPFSSAQNMGRISLLAFKTSSSSGLRTALYLLAIVSISICVGNLIPIPTFDGGQMLICCAEMIYHRPLKPRAYLILHIIGLTLAWAIVIVMNSFSFISSIFS